MSTFVYFIQAGPADGAIKIGYSADVERRLSSLRTGNHEPLTLLAAFEHAEAERVEGALHEYFAELRLQGEWYRFDRVLADFIDAWRSLYARLHRQKDGRPNKDSGASLRIAERFAASDGLDCEGMWAVEWSHTQGCCHIQPLSESLRCNRDLLLFGSGTPTDYLLLQICPSSADANRLAASLEPALRALRAVRRITEPTG